MSGYFQRLVARAGGGMAPASPLSPTLPSRPPMADEADPFETITGPEPVVDRPENGAPPRTVRTPLAARLADDRFVPDGSVEQPTMHASIRPGNPIAAKPAERLPDYGSSRAQENVAPPRRPASRAPAPIDARQERAPTPEQRGQDAEPGPLSPGKSVETRATPTGTVERIIERFGERALEPHDGSADTSPPEPPPSRQIRATPPPVVKLAPPPLPEERAEAPTSDEPRLVIGRLQVDVMPAPAPETVRVITRETPARQRTDGRASNLRFGLGQM